MGKLRHIVLCPLLLCSIYAFAEVPVEESKFTPTGISPYFFGPYTYPVPDLDEAKTNDRLRFQLAGDCVIGHLAGYSNKDYTGAISFKLSIPLWTDRVNFNCWGELREWWKDTPQTRTLRRYDNSYALDGNGSGQIWLGLDALVLRENEKRPAIVVSVNMLTAAGGNYARARHYDAPGYHFTASFGKSIALASESTLRFSATGGFLCWQTDRGAQNDAVLAGAKVSYNHKIVSISAEYASYIGWEKFYDVPQTVKCRINFHIGRLTPFIYYVHGIKDWPFDQIRCGLCTDFKILH